MTISVRRMTMGALCAVLPLAAAPSWAQPGPPPGKAPGGGGACQPLPAASAKAEPGASGSKGPLVLAQATAGLTRADGLFPLYENPENGDLFMEVSAGQMEDGKSFIYQMQAIQGVASMGVVPNAYLSTKLLGVSRHYQKIEITQKNTNFYVDADSPLARAAGDNISDALLVSTPILAQDGEGGDNARYLICANEVFKSEALASVTPYRPQGSPPGEPEQYSVGSVDSAKSKIIGYANYPENTDIRVEYVFSHPDSKQFRSNKDSELIADPRNVSMRVRHMLIETPEDNDYVPRRADFRVGYFGPERDDLSTLDAAPYHDYISRWNLRKKHPEEAISEPVEPIVWWISNSTPVEYRDEIERGVLAWNKAFERIGFRNALVVRQQPDNADWDAGDVRYNTLYFASNPKGVFLGYGPSLTDPRTGQILGADIALEYSIVKHSNTQARAFGGAENVEAAFLGGSWSHEDPADCRLAASLAGQAVLAQAVLSARGASPEIRKRVTEQLMTAVVIHEVGHTLGLTHNMKASSSISLDTLKIADGMTTGSIMDYLPTNFMPSEGERQTYYQTELGPYDYWAIEFGYHPELQSPVEEAERQRALLSRSTDPALVFGNDVEVVQTNLGVDPRTLMHDMSSDLVAWTDLQAQAIDEAIAGLESTFVESDESFQGVRTALVSLLSTRRLLVTTVAMVVGGANMEIATAAQLEAMGKAPFEPVSKKEQKRAVDLIIKLAYAPGAYDALTPSLLKHAQYTRRGFGYSEPGRGEPMLKQDVVAKDQAFLLQYLLSPLRLNRLTAHESLGGEYTSHDLLNTLTDAIFGTSCLAQPDQFQRVGQAVYLDKLIAMAADASYDSNAKAAAENNLSKISGRVSGLCNVMVGEEIAGHRKTLRRKLSDR